MDSELPTKEQLAAQATSGRPITQSEASAIAHAESDMTGRRHPIKGGTAATAQSLHDRQQNFYGVAGEVARKPSGEVTREDAARVQHFEVCSVGNGFVKRNRDRVLTRLLGSDRLARWGMRLGRTRCRPRCSRLRIIMCRRGMLRSIMRR